MENEKISLKQKVSSVVSEAKKYWETPAKGNYIPYKEVAHLSAAGFGTHWGTMLASTIALDAGNFLVGASLQLEPVHLQIMLTVANILGMPIGIWKGWYIDNHNMKGGKFLPFILRTAFPIALLSMVMVWLPYENWSYITKAVVVWCFYFVLQIFLSFYMESYQTLQYVISPNAQERATVMSITQVLYSMAPTISNLFIPLIAGLTWGLNNIWTYRVIYPIFTVIGLVLNTIFYKKVKERIVTPKKKLESIRIIDAVREVSKNKYYWILNSASWVGFLEFGYGVILSWSFVYSDGGAKQASLGLANTVIGNSALWAMLAAPLLIRFFGKRNLLILSNIINVLLLAVLYQIYDNLLLVCVFWYLNNFVNVVNNNINIPNLNADMRDYHHWKTGVRVDGLFGPLGLIGTFIGFFTGLVIPAVYEKMGLKDDYNVLYDDAVRNNLFEVLIILAIVGAILNLIPYLFYDLTEDKHKGYVDVLKIRAMFEDYGNGSLEDGQLKESMDIIHAAQEALGKEKTAIDKSALKTARKLPKKTDEEKAVRKAEIKKAKELIAQQKQNNQNIVTAPFVMDEIKKFSTQRYIRQLESARETYARGKLYLWENLAEEKAAARALPKKTKEEKEIRSDAFALIRKKKESLKIIKKYSKENLTEPDDKVKEEIQNRETATLKESMQARKDMKAYSKALSLYSRAVAPYENARKLLEQYENYTHLDELEAKYTEIFQKEYN